jgi:threonine aldolase
MTAKDRKDKANRHFASDNWAGAPPEIMKALALANAGHAPAYGADEWTARAVKLIEKQFGGNCLAFLVSNGTAANVLGLSAMLKPHQSVLCSSVAHILVDECGAVEKCTGARLDPVPHMNGKIMAQTLEPFLLAAGNQHQSQPAVISVTQATERGTLYSIDEIRALSRFARKHGLRLHMDGARLANAAAALDSPLRDFTRAAGVDVLSFGGTKNGILFGEAVVFFDKNLAKDFPWIRKQGLHLMSKMRFIGAQFEALLRDDLWLRNARHANAMAALLRAQLEKIPGVEICFPTDINMVWCRFPERAIPKIQKRFSFHIEDPATRMARLVTSFDTSKADVMDFAAVVKQAVDGK